MENSRGHTYLEFTIKVLDLMNMWPSEKRSFFQKIKEHYILLVIVTSTLALIADFVLQFYDQELLITNLIETIVAVSALLSIIYVTICFNLRKEQIQSLVEELAIFERFASASTIQETENHVKRYTKMFIIYGIVGNICYSIIPILGYKTCNATKSEHMLKYGISCGLVARYVLPFRYDYPPIDTIILIEQIFVCCLGTSIVMTITMLVCGILTHLTTNLQVLRGLILQLSDFSGDELTNRVKWCVKYHTAIVDFSDRTNEAFTVMMLVHITWTSFIIAVLGFEVIMEPEIANTFRFFMHLSGWLGILYIVCYYGQTLIDKSSDISEAVYETRWFEKSGKIREYLCLILLRSQRPLSLRAARVKVISLATFLGVLSSAYSYFTLLLKIKP